MPAARKAVDLKRRFPKRANARATVEAIFEATARILEKEGRAGLNTNLVAERAGVSIGALYGYFPNKEAILLDMARRELDLVRDRVIEALTNTDATVHPVRAAVRAIIKGYGARSRSRRILMETLFAHGGSEEMARPVSEVANIILERGGDIFPKGALTPSPIGLYVLTRAVDSVIRSATYESVAFLSSSAFEDELVRLVMAYLSADRIAV